MLLPAASDPEAVGSAFQQHFPDGGWRASDRSDAGSGTRRFVDRLGQMLLLVALSALAIGGLGMASAAAAFAASRRPSIAILKLVGAPRATINSMLLIELGLIAGLAIVAGLAVGAAAPSLVAGFAGPLLPVPPDPSPQWLALGRGRPVRSADDFRRELAGDRRRGRTRPAQLLRGDVGEASPLSARHYLWPALALAAVAGLAIAGAERPGVRRHRHRRHRRAVRPVRSARARAPPGSARTASISAARSPGWASPRSTGPAPRPGGWRSRSGSA